MILTNAQILESLTVLASLEETGMLGYTIARNRKKLTEESREYAAKRDELLKEYGIDVGNGRFQLDPENATKFQEALKPYSELEIDIPIMQVAPDVFCSGSLTSSQMFVLDWMVE